MPDNVGLIGVLDNWLVVWRGNVVGGGLAIGVLYAWLNQGTEGYRD